MNFKVERRCIYMSHYYVNDNNLRSDKHIVSYTYKGNILKYNADNGVFSKDRVDFGTNVLLNALPDIEDNKKVLDVGCGYGAIGIAVAKSNKKIMVEMVDVNERAVDLAKENINLNKVDNVKVYLSNLYENVEDTFDYIISNPPIRAGKEIVHGVAKEGYKYLNKGGKIYLVIQKKQGSPSLEKCLFEVFGNVKVVDKKNGYFILMSEK